MKITGYLASSLIILCFIAFFGCDTFVQSLVYPAKKVYPLICVNQIGYYPSSEVSVSIPAKQNPPANIQLSDWASQLIANLPAQNVDWRNQAGDSFAVYKINSADHLPLGNKKQQFFVNDPGNFRSDLITILPDIYKPVLSAAVKSYWYQRVGYSIDTTHGGVWSRPAGHLDEKVFFHPSTDRAGESPIASPGGWYDAGDFNKYIVNAAYSIGIMLQLSQQYPDALSDNSLDFPEAGNGRNDLLDEIKYELDWMLTMQDPSDGGVHHKLTTENFARMIMPHKGQDQRFILAKSTAATLNFAACMALAARVFAKAGEEAYAKTLLNSAVKAFSWGKNNPNKPFKNPKGVYTGEYGDDDFQDELLWAKAELLLATSEDQYSAGLNQLIHRFRFNAGESWTCQMSNLAVYSLLENQSLTKIDTGLLEALSHRVVVVADSLMSIADTNAFHQPITDWHWGSNSDVLGAAMVSANAHRLTKNKTYLLATRTWTDYIFGYNPLGICYVTGFGFNSPRHIHHRASEADGVADPIPGFLVGGPNSKKQDVAHGAFYPRDCAPMESYVDQAASYASNEVCLNWNAPLVYVLGYLENNQPLEKVEERG